MSDEQAALKEKEVEQVKTAEQQTAEEQQKRLWVVTLLLDPETGEFAMQPNQNVKKSWQLDSLLEQAQKQVETNTMVRVVASIMAQANKPRKGLFGTK